LPNFYKNITPHLKFNHVIGENVSALVTVKTIIKTVNTYANSDYIKKVVEILDKGNPNNLEFLKRLFDTCCINVKYQRDPDGHEIIFTPKLLIEVGKGDCKKFTTFILSVLKCKGIEAFAKVVSYDGDSWEHIFVIVPIDNNNKLLNYITLDPVNHCKFNKEVEHKKAQVFYLNGTNSEIMNGNKLSLMGSLGNTKARKFNFGMDGISDAAGDFLGEVDQSFNGVRKHGTHCSQHDANHLSGLGNDYINGLEEPITINGTDDLGKRKTKEQKQAKKADRKVKRKKIFNAAKKVGFAPVRAAFLALVALGGALQKTKLKINLAGKLAVLYQKDKEGLLKIWTTFGGKPEALTKAIARAAKTSLRGEDINISGDGSFQIEGIGIVTATAAAATITTAAPIFIAVMNLLKKHKIVTDQETDTADKVVDNLQAPDMQQTQNEPLVKEGVKMDAGGNVETQKEIIKETVTPNKEGETEDFRTVAIRTKQEGQPLQTDTTSQPKQEGQPLQTDTTSTTQPTAASFFANWKSPLSWLKAALILSVLISYHHLNIYVSNGLQFVVTTMLIFTIVNLIIKKIKSSYGKIQL
jgi:hypothetical protein